MALLTASARRASALLRPMAAAAPFSSIRRRSYSSSSSSIRFLHAKAASCRAEAASYRAEAATFRAEADSLRAATHDGELLSIIDSAIHSYNGNLGKEIPGEFPFEISKIEELTRIDVTLTRCLKGEKIEVLVSMSRLDEEEEDEDHLQESSNSSSSSSDNENPSSSDDSSWSKNSTEEYNLPIRKRIEDGLPLTVTVSKRDGSSMQFSCNAYHDEIIIDTVFVKQRPLGAEEGDINAYDEAYLRHFDLSLVNSSCHVVCSDMDKNLQEGLHKYLDVRGITPNNIKLIHEYIISKERQLYEIWLAMLRHFIKKN
ncbi:hypothetical protein VPH35_049625 [Triticum aestivum]